MRRRDLPKLLFAPAAGFAGTSVNADDSSTAQPPQFPRTQMEIDANVVPKDTKYPSRPWLDARREGCLLDGRTDDFAALRQCLSVIGSSHAGLIIDGPLKVGSNLRIAANVMLQFVGSGRLQPAENVTIDVEGDIVIGAYKPPWDLTAIRSNVITPVTRVLGATEGVTSTSYVSALMHGLVVPPKNPGNERYWTANFTLEVPRDTNISELDVRQDHVAVSGHSVTAAPHSRIWAVVGAAVNSSKAASNAEVGTCLGGEFDVNNNTGYDITDLNGNGDIGGVMIASGGANTAKFGICMSKLSTAKGFLAGWLVIQNSIDPRGYIGYFGGVAPKYGLNFATDYSGGACMITPVGVCAVELRTTSGNHARMLSVGTTLQFNGGSGGVAWFDNADTRVNASLSDGGAFQAFALAHKQQQKAINGTSIDASLGGQVICRDSTLTKVTTIVGSPVIGQQLTLIAYTDRTVVTANAGKLKGNIDFPMPEYGTLRLEWDGRYWFETGRKD
jgi:hypothetical protein